MIKSDFEVEVIVNGSPLREYLHEGKLFIEGRKDSKFSLRFKNNSSQRAVFVPSVDGLSILSGKSASFSSNGYIVGPYSTITVDGWRTSNKDVAQFFFSSPDKSYAKRKGKGGNLGAIGCVVFRQKTRSPLNEIEKYTKFIPDNMLLPKASPGILPSGGTYEVYARGVSIQSSGGNLSWDSTSLSSANGLTTVSYSNSNGVNQKYSVQALGTGWGDKKHSEVEEVSFEREDSPSALFEIFYNTKEELQKIGVSLDKEITYIAPSSFPAETHYCEPPEK